MPRGTLPGLRIPPTARTKIRKALVKRGDQIRGPHLKETGVYGGLYAVAEMMGTDHSHLCRILPARSEPKRFASYELLVALLAEIPRPVQNEVRTIFETLGERLLLDAMDDAQEPLRIGGGALVALPV